MFIEILLGVCISILFIYMFYLYLGWCDANSYNRDLYAYDPTMLLEKDRPTIEKYGSYILPTYLSDTYKPIRFWVLYLKAKLGY